MVAKINGNHPPKQSNDCIYVDNWCNPNLLRAVAAEWPDSNWPFWHRYDDGKLATKDPARLPASATVVIQMLLNLRIDVDMGIPDAFPDFNLHGAGMHCHPRGSRLGIHCDAERHPLTGWERSVSAILYVEPDWNPEWGGQLEFWKNATSGPVAKIAPTFNRLVIFKTPGIYHGMPEAVRCPEDRTRKSLAVFFWRQAEDSGGATRSQFVN